MCSGRRSYPQNDTGIRVPPIHDQRQNTGLLDGHVERWIFPNLISPSSYFLWTRRDDEC